VFTIAKRFEFSASHQLTHLAAEQPDHQCARLHGHNYVVELELQSREVNEQGFVRDYGELSEFKRWLDTEVDHRHLNHVLRGYSEWTTAENLARWIFHGWAWQYPELSAVRVSETPKTWAEYRPALHPLDR
jgi:6-pyruvoyltetrahydropterin/6-carboxytetrahydropterin synthase